MTVEQFEDTLRQFIRRKPFVPFVVEMLDGRKIEVQEPGVSFGGGAAVFLTEEDLIDFACEDVRAMHLATHESAS